jgi:hypothetical protein
MRSQAVESNAVYARDVTTPWSFVGLTWFQFAPLALGLTHSTDRERVLQTARERRAAW